jgi:hypothetical protein
VSDTVKSASASASLKDLFVEVGLSEPDFDKALGSRYAGSIGRHYFDRKSDNQGRIALVSELLGQAVKDGSPIGWSTSECPGGPCGPLFMHVRGKRIALVS